MMLIGGFFDPFFDAERRAFEALKSRKESVFIITPSNHLGDITGDLVIHVDDDEAPLAGQYPWPLLLDWLDHHLKGAPLTQITPGDVWVMSPTSGRFRKTPQWPEPTTTTTLYPTATATLSEAAPSSSSSSSSLSWRSDPAAPLPARGGASLLAFAFFPFDSITPGPLRLDQGEARPDRLVFRSPPLPRSSTLRGAIGLDVVVRSSAPDGAVVARLSVEDDDGAFLIREAAATLRFPRDDHRRPLAPLGEPVAMHLDFWPIEWTLRPGQRLRLDISSSSSPVLHTHNNRDEPWASATGADVAELTLVVDDARSALSLPLDPPPWP